MANEIAERYSQGLYELARETGTVEEKNRQYDEMEEFFRPFRS